MADERLKPEARLRTPVGGIRGRGAIVGLDGTTIEFDAAVMDSNGRLGAVACLQRVKNPVLVAQAVSRSPHWLLAGEGAERFALKGMPEAIRRVQWVCIAAHDFRADRGEGNDFRTRAFVQSFLKDAGFTLVSRDSDPRYYVPYHIHGKRD